VPYPCLTDAGPHHISRHEPWRRWTGDSAPFLVAPGKQSFSFSLGSSETPVVCVPDGGLRPATSGVHSGPTVLGREDARASVCRYRSAPGWFLAAQGSASPCAAARLPDYRSGSPPAAATRAGGARGRVSRRADAWFHV